MARLGSWIESHPEGIYVRPADAWVDPSQPKPKALITHGHSDHARGGHGAVLATAETLAIMEVRCGPQNGQTPDRRTRGSPLEVLGVALRLGLTSFGGPIAHLGYYDYIDTIGILAALEQVLTTVTGKQVEYGTAVEAAQKVYARSVAEKSQPVGV